jgi:uncharacterized protein (DUF488 family)
MEPAAVLTVYTIGHSHHPLERFLLLLAQHGVEVVADARSRPYSRFAPQYNRERLTESLEAASIRYEYWGQAVGGRPPDPALYHGGQLPSKGADPLHALDYAKVAALPAYQEAIAGLLAEAGSKRVCLLCAEEDPARCHRHHLIAQSLMERGARVLHIRGDGRVEEATRETG